jgi:hypothetical protein
MNERTRRNDCIVLGIIIGVFLALVVQYILVHVIPGISNQ